MSLTPEQTSIVASWVAAGDNLSAVQKKLHDAFGVSMTYMDVRFLVDDLNLELKDPPKKVDTSDLSKAAAANPPDAGQPPLPADDEDVEDDAVPASPGAVTVSVDAVTLLPGALASGQVTFSDGVTAKWIVDNYGRPGFTEVSQPDYRPSPEDAKVFMGELDAALQKKGL